MPYPEARFLASPFDQDWLNQIRNALVNELTWDRPISPLSGQPIKRGVVWLAECGCKYEYSGLSFSPQTPPTWFADFQQQVFKAAGVENIGFDCCNLNLYNGKEDFVDWHADNEQLFKDCSGVPILSLSLGATRLFQFKNKSTHIVSEVTLTDGDLVFMCGSLQQTHSHRLPPAVRNIFKINRFNLTWRKIAKHKCPGPTTSGE